MKKPFEETIEFFKKASRINKRAAVDSQGTPPPAISTIATIVGVMFLIELFYFPPWLEYWMLLPVIIVWGLVQSYKYSYGKADVDQDAGE